MQARDNGCNCTCYTRDSGMPALNKKQNQFLKLFGGLHPLLPLPPVSTLHRTPIQNISLILSCKSRNKKGPEISDIFKGIHIDNIVSGQQKTRKKLKFLHCYIECTNLKLAICLILPKKCTLSQQVNV
jgi:hypothetical protein